MHGAIVVAVFSRLVISSTNPEAHARTIECAFAVDQGRCDDAKKACDAAIAKEPQLAFAHYLNALCAPPAEARKQLAYAAELAPRASDGERLLIDAQRARAEGRNADAARLYDVLVEQLPDEPRAFWARAQFRIESLGMYEDATHDLVRSIELEPKFAPAYALLADVETRARKFDAAEQSAKRLVDIVPKEPEAMAIRAEVALSKGDFAEAVTRAKAAIALGPKHARAKLALADALLASGKDGEAKRIYKELGNTDRAIFAAIARGGREAEGLLRAEAKRAITAKQADRAARFLVELAWLLVDRGAVAESVDGIKQARAQLAAPDATTAMCETERRELELRLLEARVGLLVKLGERTVAESLADALPSAPQLTELRGRIALLAGDTTVARAALQNAHGPLSRLALADATAKEGDGATAKTIYESLSKNGGPLDFELAVAKASAKAALKSTKLAKPAAR